MWNEEETILSNRKLSNSKVVLNYIQQFKKLVHDHQEPVLQSHLSNTVRENIAQLGKCIELCQTL